MTNKAMPEGWVLVSLGKGLAVDVQPGFACGAHNKSAEGVPHLRPMNVSVEGTIEFGDMKFVPPEVVDREARWIRAGDVLFNNTNSPELVGKTALYDLPQPRAFSNHMTRIRCNTDVLDPRFCAHVLHQYWREGYFKTVANNHVSQASVSRAVLLEVPIPVPPLAEQRRIVAKLEEVLAQVNAARERLERVPAILKRFRQAVLAAACSGRLTEGWREDHEINELAYVSDLLPGWRSGELADLCESIADGDHQPPPKRTQGIPFLVIGNINSGVLDFSQTRFVPRDYYDRIKPTRKPRPGDILYAVVGATIGTSARVETEQPFCFQRHIAILKPRSTTDPRFLHLLMRTQDVQRQSWENVTGSAQPTLPLGALRSIQVPIPPLSEQQEIVRRVEALFAWADAVERRVAAARGRVEKLTQAVLAKAFRGELVPTEAEVARGEGREYEPAAVLLGRIRPEQQLQLPNRGQRQL